MIHIIVLIAIIYTMLASVGCKALAVSFYPLLASIHGDDNVKIAACNIKNKNYGHAYLLVNGKPYEPRFLGCHLVPHIDYNNPIQTWNNVEDFRRDYSLIPFKRGKK